VKAGGEFGLRRVALTLMICTRNCGRYDPSRDRIASRAACRLTASSVSLALIFACGAAPATATPWGVAAGANGSNDSDSSCFFCGSWAGAAAGSAAAVAARFSAARDNAEGAAFAAAAIPATVTDAANVTASRFVSRFFDSRIGSTSFSHGTLLVMN